MHPTIRASSPNWPQRPDVVVVEADGADAVDALGFDELQAPVKVAITPFWAHRP